MIHPDCNKGKPERPRLRDSFEEQGRFWLWSRCLHEAGHALSALAVDIRFSRVTVSAVPDGSFLLAEMEHRRPVASATVYYGGHAAIVAHYFGSIFMDDDDACRWGAAKDYQYVDDLGLGLLEKWRAQDQALKIVKQRRAALYRLTDALMERGELDTRAVTAIVRHRCSQPLPQWSAK